jgi:hypothetical protein
MSSVLRVSVYVLLGNHLKIRACLLIDYQYVEICFCTLVENGEEAGWGYPQIENVGILMC